MLLQTERVLAEQISHPSGQTVRPILKFLTPHDSSLAA